MLAIEAKERLIDIGKKYGEGHPKQEGVVTIPHPLVDTGKARDHAAAMVGTNGKYVQDAKSIKYQTRFK